MPRTWAWGLRNSLPDLVLKDMNLPLQPEAKTSYQLPVLKLLGSHKAACWAAVVVELLAVFSLRVWLKGYV